MPIRRRNPRKKIILAGVQGLIIGVVGVLLFGFILNLANDKKVEVAKEEDTTPAAEQSTDGKIEVAADGTLSFHAKQYGMFSSKESALNFMATQPTLEKASVVQVENQFFIWSDLFLNDAPTTQTEALPSFTKKVLVSTSGCENPKVKKVMNILQEDNISINFFDSIVKKEDYPDDLMTIVQAVSTLSNVSSVMRLHVFTHYLEQNTCVKLNF
ncbi:hypothetical protein [Psychrobacillus soli]|uniref:Uncharacterized protein n=1 Tax=Psychrobacillus soli TaxID=1543965 RepID=A0A544TBI6_9BACI|nr:hypothetical protein [Psychrobacillus soli]TQR14830.1 hypothetical protein FG383_10135 [Psychrobacillus soli]